LKRYSRASNFGFNVYSNVIWCAKFKEKP